MSKKYKSTSAMKPEVKSKWIEALRSGKYNQTTSILEDSTGNCCLGVLCRIMKGKEFKYNGDGCFGPEHADTSLTVAQRNKVGLSDEDEARLICMNDSGDNENYDFSYKKSLSFKQIATWIERNIPVKVAA